jgi:lipoprotein-releasing system permease protein
MYKWLLCFRYLRTRYLAMACIVSVMLGVGTLIVVNSVMGGFSKKLKDRLHGLLSDIVIESHDPVYGFSGYERKMELIRSDPFLNERIEAMAPTLEIFAMLQYENQGFSAAPIARPVRLIGIDPVSRSRVGGFAEHLLRTKENPSFALSAEVLKRQRDRHRGEAGFHLAPPEPPLDLAPFGEKPPPEPPPSKEFVPEGVIVGYSLAHYRDKKTKLEVCTLDLGADAIITTLSGQKMQPVYARFAVVDHFKSEMSEYDSSYVFVPLEFLQKLRAMEGKVTSIQIRLKNSDDYEESKKVVERLEAMFGNQLLVSTWIDKQGPLLSAIAVEKGILNVLLFLIIAVAGFGILAIFSMIVVEKTRDIGILKALGASNGGVLKIFLGYGMLLGVVGILLGTVFGVLLTIYINPIEMFLTKWTGQELFPRDVYYFDSIPTDLQPMHIALINAGALAIAVLFSVLPALRAAMLHPVRALRAE